MTKLVVATINAYRKFISPYFARRCRYEPTCSTYAMDSFGRHGFFKGAALSIWRVLRCNPFSRGGYDPINSPIPKPVKAGTCSQLILRRAVYARRMGKKITLRGE